MNKNVPHNTMDVITCPSPNRSPYLLEKEDTD